MEGIILVVLLGISWEDELSRVEGIILDGRQSNVSS